MTNKIGTSCKFLENLAPQVVIYWCVCFFVFSSIKKVGTNLKSDQCRAGMLDAFETIETIRRIEQTNPALCNISQRRPEKSVCCATFETKRVTTFFGIFVVINQMSGIFSSVLKTLRSGT